MYFVSIFKKFLLFPPTLCSSCLFFKPLCWRYACTPTNEDHNSWCVWHVYYCLATSTEHFLSRGLDWRFTCTFQNKMLQVKQALYLPGRAAWAPFAPVTSRICFQSERHTCCTILGLEVCRNKAKETSLFMKMFLSVIAHRYQ